MSKKIKCPKKSGISLAKGYKQTKIGITPKDWKESQLKDILLLSLEPLKMEDKKEYELITVRRRFGGVDSRGIFQGKKILVKNQFYVRKNNFVISKRQISHGACGLIPKRLDGAIVSNEYNVFKVNEKLLDVKFLNYYVRQPKFSRTFYSYSDGIHIEKLLFKTQSWLKQKIPFPPLKEQQKIAKILTTWDKAIEKQEALIVAKEEFKKGLMQRLLSGDNKQWKRIELSKVLEISSKKFNPKKSDENKKCIELEHLSQNSGILLGFTNSKEQQSIKNIFQENNVLYGKLRPYLKKYWKAEFEGVCSTEIWVLNGKSVINDYLFYLVQTNKFNQIANVSSGSKMPRADWKYMADIPFNIPPKQEQQEIAQILTTADKEIELLKNELEVLREQKRGLMQRLLMGEVRVRV